MLNKLLLKRTLLFPTGLLSKLGKQELQEMNNPLQRLINQHIQAGNISKSDLVQKIGYRNVTKGLRRLDEFAESLEGSVFIRDGLADILNIGFSELVQVLADTSEAIRHGREKSFHPFINVTLDKAPRPIFVTAATPYVLEIKVERSLRHLTFDEEIAKVRELYRDHYKKYDGRHITGNALFTGFRYYREYSQTLIFDNECHLLEIQSDIIPPLIGRLTI